MYSFSQKFLCIYHGHECHVHLNFKYGFKHFIFNECKDLVTTSH